MPIQFKRGLQANLPAELLLAEPAFTTDTHRLYIGGGTGIELTRFYNSDEVDTLVAGYSLTSHNHDSRYYTETEIDTLLAGYSPTSHNHDSRYYTETEINTLLADYSPTSHNHDSRYYTETEIDTFLAGYSATSHNHDSRYYTETEIDAFLADYSPTSHNHDSRYYTETEIDTLLAGYSPTSHNHDSRYYTETEVDTLLTGYSATSHNHDSRYYTETEINDLLTTKSDTGHGHDDTYFKNSYIVLAGEGISDKGMTGFYDRNELTFAHLRGVITVSVTGAGEGSTIVSGGATNASGSVGAINNTDLTTTQVVILIDMLSAQGNYSAAVWHPFLQYRYNPNTSSATYFAGVKFEMSADNVTWHMHSGWETTNFAADMQLPGLWFGTNGTPTGLPGNQWRYVRVTLTDRRETAAYSGKASVWIAELGMRHVSAPFARQYAQTSGAILYGAYQWRSAGTATNTAEVAADGSAKLNNLLVGSTGTRSARFEVQGTTVGEPTGRLKAVASQTANILEALDSTNGVQFAVAPDGSMVQAKQFITKRMDKTLASGVQGSILTITTNNPAGSVDGGSFDAKVTVIVGHGNLDISVGGSGSTATRMFEYRFSKQNAAGGGGNLTALTTVYDGGLLASAPATRTITSVTPTLVATSGYVTNLDLNVVLGGTNIDPAGATVDVYVELLWRAYRSAPAIT